MQGCRRWIALAVLSVVARSAAAMQDHTYSSAEVATGIQLYAAQCALCHGPNGDQINGIDLRRGRFRRAVTDDDLVAAIRTGSPAGMPAFRFSDADSRALVALIRAGFDPAGTAVKVGNIERGRLVFTGRGRCATCHRTHGAGPRTWPDLTDIGALRTAATLQRVLLDPSAAMLPINRPTRIVTSDGRTIQGRRVNEDTFSVQLIDDGEQMITIEKRMVRRLEVLTVSPMEPVMRGLSADEVADLVAYLLSLRGMQ